MVLRSNIINLCQLFIAACSLYDQYSVTLFMKIVFEVDKKQISIFDFVLLLNSNIYNNYTFITFAVLYTVSLRT